MESLPDSATGRKISFQVNDKFDNFANLEKKIEQYRVSTNWKVRENHIKIKVSLESQGKSGKVRDI